MQSRQSAHAARVPQPRRAGARRHAGVAEYAKIFKAYDIRGVVPDELDEDAAR